MKLYVFDAPPYSVRVRLAVYAKNLRLEMEKPPGPTKSLEMLAINPSGRIPALILDNGEAIPESSVIIEYLEDVFPETPLRPSDPKARARARVITQAADLYLGPSFDALSLQMNPQTRDQAVVDSEMGKLRWGLAFLNTALGAGPHAVAEEFTTADCALVPLLYFVERVTRGLGHPGLLEDYAKVSAYWSFARTQPLAMKVIEEMELGIAAMRAAQKH